jgi:triosephosphate isomerase
MGRMPFIAGNWKMNKTVGEALDLVRALKTSLSGISGVEVAVAPPFTALHAVSKELTNSPIRLAAQNVFWEEKGAFTGEISPVMLRDVGCDYVIIGHSERRQFFGETDETVHRRIQTALKHGLKPILCVGETLAEREGEKTFAVMESQIRGGLQNLSGGDLRSLVIAYEPVWAIGTGKTATPQQAEDVHRFIREEVEKMISRQFAEGVRIQYGGSVTPENVKGLMEQKNIDGALVGGASLKEETFARIVRFGEM